MRENTYRPAFLSGLPGAVRSEADLHVRAVPAEAEDTACTLVLKVFLKIQKAGPRSGRPAFLAQTRQACPTETRILRWMKGGELIFCILQITKFIVKP